MSADPANAQDEAKAGMATVGGIPIRLSVELGSVHMTIEQLLSLSQGAVIELDSAPGEPMDIMVNGYLIARGEAVVLDDKFGIRITSIVTPEERASMAGR